MATTHTVTLTRKLQDEAADLFGNANHFSLKIDQYGTRQVFNVTWGGLPVPSFKSRKEVHEWVISKIALRRELMAA